ncbi:hypothetical protein D1BOALGB6SA_393 [Olavius sp. associated proteobacterium Delta 1]|nr:hypothetical protein D1BOALGB6SA_393 [Olavius sp. associated proteobacterium Delta 1]
MIPNNRMTGNIFKKGKRALLVIVLLLIVNTSLAFGAEALLVVGSYHLNDGDRTIKHRLQHLGFTVTVKNDDHVRTSDADGKDLVLLSETVYSIKVKETFTHVPVPIICWESWLFDDLAMTGPAQDIDYGNQHHQNKISIINADHPLAASLSGTVAVSSHRFNLGWGIPGDGAITVASLQHDAAKYPIFAYEKGMQMPGLVAPARRIGLFLFRTAPYHLTGEGWALFDAAVDWAIDRVRPKALFVVGAKKLKTADRNVRDLLEDKGFAVTVKTDNLAEAADADGKDLILISQTAYSNNISDAFTAVPVPVICWEPWLYDDLAMTGPAQNVDYGNRNYQKRTIITNPDHPLASFLSGTVNISNYGLSMGWGVPAQGAITIAALDHDPAKHTIFAYEKGMQMTGREAPAKRVGFFLHGDTRKNLNAYGWALFEAAVDWALAPQSITILSQDTEFALAAGSPGVPVYLDEETAIAELSQGLKGGLLVRTTDSDRQSKADVYLKLRANSNVIVYVCYDGQARTLPYWLNEGGWTLTEEFITTTRNAVSPRWVSARELSAGETITLGGNLAVGARGAEKNYFVMVLPRPAGRVKEDLAVLYTFEEKDGDTVHDVSGVGVPLDLTIADPAAVSWIEGGGLSIDAATLVASADAATKVIDACKSGSAITIEAWIKPATVDQDGPARIVTLSDTDYRRNFTLGHGLWGNKPQDLVNVRLRTTATGNNGINPSVTSPAGSLTAEMTHVVYTFKRSGEATIYINGVAVAQRHIHGDLSNWDDTMQLGLANEMSANRPWLGEYHLLAIYGRALSLAEIGQNFKARRPEPTPAGEFAEDLAVLYSFTEGSGNTVHDVSGNGEPLNLTIQDPAAVSWLEGGGLSIDSQTLVASAGAATKLIEACKASNEITVAAWIRPAAIEQAGPARIVTLSDNPYTRDFTLGHGLWSHHKHKDHYNMRLRTTLAGYSGMHPFLSTPDGAVTTNLSYVVYTRDRYGDARFYIDGVEVKRRTIRGDFANWNDNVRLGLANEITGNRPWLGEYHLLAIYSRALGSAEVSQNYARGVSILPTVHFAALPQFLTLGLSSKLRWRTAFAAEVSIAPDVGAVAAGGYVDVIPPEGATTYTLTATGPGGESTADVTLQVITEPRIVISGAQLTPEGVYTMLFESTPPYPVSGTYELLTGSVQVTARSGDVIVAGSGSDGNFSLDLPEPGQWRISVSEPDGWLRAFGDVDLMIDDEPPLLIVDGPAELSLNDDFIVVTGIATDTGAGLDSVVVTSDRYADHPFAAIVSELGGFSCEVPLGSGDNYLAVIARDAVGNQSQKDVKVMVQPSALPRILILTPVNGTTLYVEQIDVAGLVRSSLPPGQIRLVHGDQVQFPTGADGEYSFTFEKIRLVEGSNALEVRAETAYGNVSAQTVVNYLTEQAVAEEIRPTVEIQSLQPGAFISNNRIVISGVTKSEQGIQKITVNGQDAEIVGQGAEVSFKYELLFLEDQDDLAIVVEVTDGQGNTETITFEVHHDDLPPVIQLTSPGLAAAPAVNVVAETPYPLAGSLTEKNLTGFSINGRSISVIPTGVDDSYAFNAGLILNRGQEQPIILEAWDHAGNRTSREVILKLDAALGIEVISPRDGAELMADGETLDVAVTVRLPGITDHDLVRVSIDDGDFTTLNRAASVANGNLVVAATDGEHKLTVEAVNTSDTLLARITTRFTVVNTDNIPLAVKRQEPENSAEGVEPNEFIAVYFNKPVDPTQLQIQVFETAHGLGYDAPEKGADITQLSEVELVEIHRDREQVPGGISHFPGNTMVAFYPGRDFAYGATVFIDVLYNSEVFVRSSFKIRPMPTFIQGFVSDQFMQPIAGIEVAIPQLGRNATSDSNGSYGFGFGDRAEKSIPASRYRAVINPNLNNRAFGMVERWINVAGGRLNSVGLTQLPMLNPDEPFRHISSGQPEALLAAGDLFLDLSDTTLNFPDGRNHGDVHVQFMKLDQIAYPTLPSAAPHWAFAVQPMGIEVSGRVGMIFNVPPLYGSHEYVANIGERVILVGYDPDALQIVPAGVGLVDKDTNQVTSEGEVALQRLDYLGYALVDVEDQAILERYANGEISLRQMIGELESQ